MKDYKVAKVNLDAFIPREDFLVEGEDKNINLKNIITIQDLTGITADLLRKPDFQRETSDWDNKKIAELLKSFINGDLIPSVIFWKGKGNIFVIDGAHRLSALMAWLYDDYGDGEISKKFYKNIPEDQLKSAGETRNYINRQVGSYENLKRDLNHQVAISINGITLQWVNGDAKTAEQSFLKINQQAQPINSTELRLLESRNKPVCIAARAIIYGGTGHKYWATFSAEKQNEIVEISSEIHNLLFKPPLKQPVKNIELPIGGKTNASTALKMILDFTKITNSIKDEKQMKDDTEGKETISILKNTRKLVWRLNSVKPPYFSPCSKLVIRELKQGVALF